MKMKKIFALPLMGALFAVSCSMNNGNANTQANTTDVAPASIVLNANHVAMASGISPAAGVEKAVLPSILGNITSSGGNILSGALATGTKYIVTNILKDYGIDIRDPSIAYLEKIDGEIKEIKAKIDVLSANEEKHNAERSLDNLYSYVEVASTDIMNQVKGGLWSLATLENDASKDGDYVEAQRKDYYETSLKNFTAKGSNIADFTTRFANTIVTPVSSAPTTDLFHYYQLTNGQFDKWSTQSYKNRRNYIAYLDSLLLTSANLAIFDNHYRSEGASVGVKGANDTRFSNMVTAVNNANAYFQTELKRLDEYEALRQKGEIIYLPTGVHYSSKMATYTFNHQDSENAQLLKGVEYRRTDLFHVGEKNLQNYLMTYQANHKMVNDVVTDYTNYVDAYGLKDYSINQYLKEIGFSAENQSLFDKANGLYYGELRLPRSGYLKDDMSVKAHIYDKFGKAQDKTQFFIEAHHGFLSSTTYQVKYSDEDYYLCFVKADGKLDGEYWGNTFAGKDANLVYAFGEFMKNRFDSNDPIVKGAKFQ